MMRTITLLSLICYCYSSLPAQPVQLNLLGNWHDPSIPPTIWYNNRYNEVWGFTINGGEFAVLGSTQGMHIIDLNDPAQPQEVARIYGEATGVNLVHRDFKDYDGYLYCVADEGATSTLQIIDLYSLPDTATVVYSSNEFVVRAHNLYIDTAQQRLYLLGAGSTTRLLDISNPTQPVLLAQYPNGSLPLPYVHDAYIKDNIGYMNCAGSGLWVVDFTDPQAPVLLGTLTDYPDAGYNHSGWLSDDGNYYFLCDETHGMDIKIVDVSDPADMVVLSKFSPGLWNQEIPHNVIVRGHLVYASYYYDGVQVWDFTEPTQPRRWGYYDTYPDSNIASYAGNWGIFPLLPSNTILASDMQGGLFVLEGLPQPSEVALSPSATQLELCEGEPLELMLAVGSGFKGPNLSLSATFDGQPLTLAPGSLSPGDTLTLTIGDLPSTQGNPATLALSVSDGAFTGTALVGVTVFPKPDEAQLVTPLPGEMVSAAPLLFTWQPVPEASTYTLQVSTDADNFEGNLVFEETTADTFSIGQNTVVGEQYYWRVLTGSEPCRSASEVRSFQLLANATAELAGAIIEVYPVPAWDFIFLSSKNPVLQPLTISLQDLNGKELLRKDWPVMPATATLGVSTYPPGMYLLTLRSERKTAAVKVVIGK